MSVITSLYRGFMPTAASSNVFLTTRRDLKPAQSRRHLSLFCLGTGKTSSDRKFQSVFEALLVIFLGFCCPKQTGILDFIDMDSNKSRDGSWLLLVPRVLCVFGHFLSHVVNYPLL